MLESVLVYGLLTTLMVFCGIIAAQREPVYLEGSGHYVVNKKFLKPEIVIIISVFSFVFGCRWGVGVDYFHYYNAYRFGTERDFEMLFRVISDGMTAMNLHYALFFGFWAFLQISLLLWAFKNYRFLLPYLLFYLIVGNYFMSMMNIIRHQIAALIFLCSIQFIVDKKPIHYYICIAIAFLFHKSSMILVVMYPILRYRDDWFRSIPLQLGLLAVAVYLNFRYDLVARYVEEPFVWFARNLGYDQYQLGILTNEALNDKGQFGANTGYGIFVELFKCTPIFLLSKNLKSYYNSSFFNMLYSMWVISILSGLVCGSSVVLNRPFVFFSDVKIAMIAFFTYYCFKKRDLTHTVLGIAMIMVYITMFLFILSNGAINTSAFTFFWQR